MKFIPVSHSWVALHPQPKGVVQFIGGAFVGTFGPATFYSHLLEFLYDQKYTLILLPFKFTFNHYQEAGFLIGEQYEILPELVRLAISKNYSYEAYLDNYNFYWLGHSIGCKYITLLEGFSALPKTPEKRKIFIETILSKTDQPRKKEQIDKIIIEIEALIADLQNRVKIAKQSIKNQIQEEIVLGDNIATLFIKGQISVFLAPDNSDTKTALFFEPLAKWLDNKGLGVSPSPQETYNLIIESNLFNKLGLVTFEADTTAEKTVDGFIKLIQKPPDAYRLHGSGGHFRPTGLDIFNEVMNPIDILYSWLRYLLRIDPQKPIGITPVFQSKQVRNSDLEAEIVSLYSQLQN